MWSQAFYYGIWAAILYFVDASLMVVTFWGAWKGRYDKDFMLTPSQRTLMLQTILFLMYLLLGALVFSNIEGWNYLDAVYWADVTLFTVGFGDFLVETKLGRALLIPYALVGIISLGLVIGSIRSLVLDRGRRRMAARVEERKRRKMVRSMTSKGKDEILEPIQDTAASTNADTRSDNLPGTEFERRKAEFELMRKIQDQASNRRKWIAMGISTGSWILLWLVGALVFLKCEKPYQPIWTYFDAFYFCFVTLTTIGYGDRTPISPGGKSFFVFWSLLALPTMTVLISNAGDTVVKFVRDATLHLGTVTILPDERGFKKNTKHIIWRLTGGRILGSDVDVPKNDTQGSGDSMAKSEEDNATTPYDDEDIEARGRPELRRRNPSTFTSHVRRSLSRLRDPYNDLPIGTDFHFLLISEIQVVAKHLKESKPHRYSFEQWAWYLKLIGEDERSAETHRKARPKPRHKHKHLNRNSNNNNDDDVPADIDTKFSWSWVGHRSPLMGSVEESEWILNKLMERLRDSLSSETRRREAREAHREAQEVYHMNQTDKEEKKG